MNWKPWSKRADALFQRIRNHLHEVDYLLGEFRDEIRYRPIGKSGVIFYGFLRNQIHAAEKHLWRFYKKAQPEQFLKRWEGKCPEWAEDCRCMWGHVEDCANFDPARELHYIQASLQDLDTMLHDGFSVAFTLVDGQVKMTLTHPSQVEEFDGETVEEALTRDFPGWFSECQTMM